MDGCKGRQERATKRKERPKFRVATAHARRRTLGSDSTRDYTGVERSFPLYAPDCIYRYRYAIYRDHEKCPLNGGEYYCVLYQKLYSQVFFISSQDTENYINLISCPY